MQSKDNSNYRQMPDPLSGPECAFISQNHRQNYAAPQQSRTHLQVDAHPRYQQIEAFPNHAYSLNPIRGQYNENAQFIQSRQEVYPSHQSVYQNQYPPEQNFSQNHPHHQWRPPQESQQQYIRPYLPQQRTDEKFPKQPSEVSGHHAQESAFNRQQSSSYPSPNSSTR